MLSSKLTTKCQATIPLKVREALGLKAGDVVGFEIEAGKVFVRAVRPLDVEYAHATAGTLGEWASQEDEEAYHGL